MHMLKLGSLLQVAFVGISRERFTSSCASVVEEDLAQERNSKLNAAMSSMYRPRCKPVIFSKVIQFLTKEVAP